MRVRINEDVTVYTETPPVVGFERNWKLRIPLASYWRVQLDPTYPGGQYSL